MDSSFSPTLPEDKQENRNLFAQSDADYIAEVNEWVEKYRQRGWRMEAGESIRQDGICTCGDPNCKSPGKHPKATSRNRNSATLDPAKLKEMFSTLSNIILPTGDSFFILDLDTKDGKNGPEEYRALCADYFEPETLMQLTGSGNGAMHIAFNPYSGLKMGTDVLAVGIDVRNEFPSYIMGAPSRHISGGKNEWMNWDTQLCNLPYHLTHKKEKRGRPRKNDPANWKLGIEELTRMVGYLPVNNTRDEWRNEVIIIGRETNRSDEGWALCMDRANKYGKQRGDYEKVMRECFYDISQQECARPLKIATLIQIATENGYVRKAGRDIPIGDLVYCMDGNIHLYRKTGKLWIAAAVDAGVAPVNVDGRSVAASAWLREHCRMTSITNDPGIPDEITKGFNCIDGVLVPAVGASTFNTYRPPTIEMGDAELAGPGLDHFRKIFNKEGDADQVLNYMAHRVQKPWEKPRFALLIGGPQGNGKDTAVDMCGPAIGGWNIHGIEPSALDQSFNEWAAGTLLRISEAANLHEMNKWAFNEKVKVLICGNPDDYKINPKYGLKYTVRLHCGVILTTNHLLTGVYIPPGDRRYDVIQSAEFSEMGLEDENDRRKYFDALWDWIRADGTRHMAAFLHARDLSGFNPNGPRTTIAKRTVVASGSSTDEWLEDVLDGIAEKNNGELPIALRSDDLITCAVAKGELKHDVIRRLGPAMGRNGYVLFPKPTEAQGRWHIGGKRVTVYVKAGTPADFDPEKTLKPGKF